MWAGWGVSQKTSSDSEGTEEQLEAIREPLTVLPEAVLAQDRDELFPYSSDSLAATEAVATADGAVRDLLLRARLPVLAAGDHLKALARILAPPVLTASPWTVTRTILQATARASWLLDPSLTVKERMARYLVLEYEESRELPKRARALKPGLSLDASNGIRQQRERELREKAQFLAIPLKQGKRGGISMVGLTPTRIRTTDIVRDELDEELYYRVLSGAEHQERWALDFLSGADVSGSAGHLREFTVRPEQYWTLVKRPVWWYARAVWRYFNYLGFDLERLEAALSEAGRSAELPERYWETLPSHPSG